MKHPNDNDSNTHFRWLAAPFHRLSAYQICEWRGKRLSAKRAISGGFVGRVNGKFICNRPSMDQTKLGIENYCRTFEWGVL